MTRAFEALGSAHRNDPLQGHRKIMLNVVELKFNNTKFTTTLGRK